VGGGRGEGGRGRRGGEKRGGAKVEKKVEKKVGAKKRGREEVEEKKVKGKKVGTKKRGREEKKVRVDVESLEKNYEHVIEVRMREMEGEYKEAYKKAREIRTGGVWTEEVDEEYSKQVMEAYELLKRCEKEQGEYKEERMEWFKGLGVGEKHEVVWEELKGLRQEDRPGWMKKMKLEG